MTSNSLLETDDAGTIVARYDKRFLCRREADYMYRAGTDPVVVQVDRCRFGLPHCIEALPPDADIEYETLGVDGIIISTHTSTTPAQAQDDQRALAYATMITDGPSSPRPAPHRSTCRRASRPSGSSGWRKDRRMGSSRQWLLLSTGNQPRVRFGRERGRTRREQQRRALADDTTIR